MIAMTPLPARGNAKGRVMRKPHFVAAFTLSWAPVVAQAQPTQKPGEQVTVTGQQPARSKLICERFIPTGSIKAEKVCRSQAEFEQITKDSLTQLARIRDRQESLRQMHDNCVMAGKC
jgi:hypothetical protein